MRTSRLLRSLAGSPGNYLRTFLRGVMAGALLPGPALLAGFVYLSIYPLPRSRVLFEILSRAAPLAPVDMAGSTPELAARLAPALAGRATLVIGSSEMEASAGERSLHAELHDCARKSGSYPSAFVTLQPRGPAVLRAALLLERLRKQWRQPGPAGPGQSHGRHIVILDNSHYATAALGQWPRLSHDFPGDAGLAHHFLQYPASKLRTIADYELQFQRSLKRSLGRDFPADDGFGQFWQTRRLELQMFRNLLGRRLVRGAGQFLITYNGRSQTAPAGQPRHPGLNQSQGRNFEWNVEQRFVPEPRRSAAVRDRKNYPADLAQSVYGRSLALLDYAARHYLRPDDRLELLILQPNVTYYRRLGLDPEALERRRLTLARSYERWQVQYYTVETGAAPGHDAEFYDSIHYTTAGRRRLADFICERLCAHCSN